MLLTFLIAATVSVVFGFIILFWFSGLEKNLLVKRSQNIVSHLHLKIKKVKYSCKETVAIG